jgi:hypothetical protein
MKNCITRILFFSAILSFGLFFSCCNDDEMRCMDPANPDCENYDPCFGKTPVSADFEIAIISPHGDPNYRIADSIFPRAALRFVPKTKNAKYTWKLGSEAITEDSFYRTFYSAEYGEYTVTLIVKRNPTKIVFQTMMEKIRLLALLKSYLAAKCSVLESSKDCFRAKQTVPL